MVITGLVTRNVAKEPKIVLLPYLCLSVCLAFSFLFFSPLFLFIYLFIFFFWGGGGGLNVTT